jgi:hypothetical protein
MVCSGFRSCSTAPAVQPKRRFIPRKLFSLAESAPQRRSRRISSFICVSSSLAAAPQAPARW